MVTSVTRRRMEVGGVHREIDDVRVDSIEMDTEELLLSY